MICSIVSPDVSRLRTDASRALKSLASSNAIVTFCSAKPKRSAWPTQIRRMAYGNSGAVSAPLATVAPRYRPTVPARSLPQERWRKAAGTDIELPPTRKLTGSMKTAATRTSVLRRRNSGWRGVTWLVVLAFFLQSFVAQTHIHFQTIDLAAAATAPNVPHHNKAPVDDGGAACLFCHAVAAAGAYFAPTAPILLPPIMRSIAIALPLLADLFGLAAAHNWHSRAPPQL